MQNDRNTKRRLNTVEIQRSNEQLNKCEEKGKTQKRGEINLPVLTQRVGLFWRRRGVVEEASNPPTNPWITRQSHCNCTFYCAPIVTAQAVMLLNYHPKNGKSIPRSCNPRIVDISTKMFTYDVQVNSVLIIAMEKLKINIISTLILHTKQLKEAIKGYEKFFSLCKLRKDRKHW